MAPCRLKCIRDHERAPAGWILMALTAVLTTSPAYADEDAPSVDPLWLKAVALAGENLNWVPGIIETCTKELDKHGEAEKVHRSRLRLFANEAGEIESEILAAFENEKEITAKERAEAAMRKESRKEALERGEETSDGKVSHAIARFGNATPFDPGVQDSVTALRTHTEEHPSGGPYVAFAFDHLEKDGTISRGIAWLDAVTGAPREMRLSPDPLPKHVKRLEITVRFDHRDDGTWITRQMTVNAVGKFLFFTKRVRNEMTFSEAWWLEENARPTPLEIEVR